MTKKTGQYQIPFDVAGNLISYADSFSRDLIWKDNHEFVAPMEIVSYGRGRSSAVFYLKNNSNGTAHQMFMSNFMDMIGEVEIANGVINGDNVWTFVKKGSNYGLRFVKRGY